MTSHQTLLQLDPTLFRPKPDELEFFKETTGIQNEEELRLHILAVQKDAYQARRLDKHVA